MTPKEKAKELVFKYYDIFVNIKEMLVGTGVILQWSKQCALIAVEEIINSFPLKPQRIPVPYGINSAIDYWQQVKEEIIGM